MNFARNIIFYIIFYFWTILFFCLFSPVTFFSRPFAVKIANFWTKSIISLTRFLLLIDFEIIGDLKILERPLIIVSNHQSAWETFFFPSILPDSVFVMKDSLTKIPIFNSYFKKLGYIPINRKQGYSSTKSILNNAKKSLRLGAKHIIIFPEGTRVEPGKKVELSSSGIKILYKNLNMPIVVTKHNSGKFWKNKKFIKSKGKISIEIFPVIKTGLSKEEVIKKINLIFMKN
tara:strand:- start:2626 stop:3318 length:693 start_codon:yes stop_codon:yes gene_type:complete